MADKASALRSPGLERQDTFQNARGFVGLPGFQQGGGQVGVARHESRVDTDAFPVRGDTLGEPPGGFQRAAHVRVQTRLAWRPCQRAGECLHRVVMPPQRIESGSEIRPDCGIVRCRLPGLLVPGDGLVMPVHGAQAVGQAGHGAGVGGCKFQRTASGVRRVLGPALGFEDHGQVRVVGRCPGIAGYRIADEMQGGLGLARLMGDQAQQVQGIRASRCRLEDAPVYALSFHQPTGLMMADAGL